MRVYSCKTRTMPGRRGYGKSCGRISVKAAWIEDDVAERLIARMLQSQAAEKIAAAAGDAVDNSGTAVSEMVSLEQKLHQLGLDYADGIIGRPEFIAARDRVTARLHACERDAARPSLRVPGDAAGLMSWWEDAPLSQRQALVADQIERVEVGPHRGRRSDYDSSRVKIRWR